LKEIQSTPRLIGVIDDDSGNLTKSLYQNIVQSEILLTSVKIAEMSKLVENTFRDVNVAFANEIGMMCEEYGIDVKELIKVCNSHPRVNLLNPGPGVGGPCLPKDPYLLLHPQKGQEFNSEIITYSRKINDSMPNHVVDLLENALKKEGKTLIGCTILILGTSYKANVNDTRFSPSKEIIQKLKSGKSKVLVFDPITSESFGGQRITQIWDGVSLSDAIIVVTDHDEFKQLDLDKIKNTMKSNPIIIDTKRIFNKDQAEKLGIRYVSIGYVK
ncbi:nucleotide sugar dehydrogenase, partial [Patescibacteria group bacterium]|nr:nucleotide sugar dehydrogenase [Patescibacteria group bacterium]